MNRPAVVGHVGRRSPDLAPFEPPHRVMVRFSEVRRELDYVAAITAHTVELRRLRTAVEAFTLWGRS